MGEGQWGLVGVGVVGGVVGVVVGAVVIVLGVVGTKVLIFKFFHREIVK